MKTDSEGHKDRPKKPTSNSPPGPLSLRPRSWVNLGYSIANSEEGTFFLKNAIPGEEVQTTILKRSGFLYWGVASRISDPSSERIESDCASFP